MAEFKDRLKQYSVFLDDVLKKEELKVKEKTKCACGCTSGGVCTCVRDSYERMSNMFYEVFPELRKYT